MLNSNTIKAVVLLLVAVVSNIDAQDDILEKLDYLRRKFLWEERSRAIGSRIVLNNYERLANNIIMKLKYEELQQGFDNITKFPPARNFLEAADDIKNSKVFKILRALPKGAVLHGHDSAMVSADVIFNLTYKENLFIKIDSNNKFKEFKFSNNKPDDSDSNCKDCKWFDMTELRKNNGSGVIDNWLKPQMSLNKKHAGLDVNTIWKRFMLQFKIVTPLVTYKPAWNFTFYNTLKEYYDDNVDYIEVRARFKELHDLNGTFTKGLDVVDFNKRIVKEFKERHPQFFDAKFIYSPLRFLNKTTFKPHSEFLTKLINQHPDFVVGFDLVAQEDIGPTLKNLTKSILQEKGKTNFYFHAGETNWSGFHSDENLIDALLLGTKRIGHGYAITKHPKVAEYIKRKRIGIELCPISNQVLGLVKDMRNHPAAAMFTDDYPIVIAPDDPGFWGAKGVSYDWYEAFMGLAAKWQDLRLLKQLALNSIRQAALNRQEKAELKRLWSMKWKIFIAKVIKYNGDFSEENIRKVNLME